MTAINQTPLKTVKDIEFYRNAEANLVKVETSEDDGNVAERIVYKGEGVLVNRKIYKMKESGYIDDECWSINEEWFRVDIWGDVEGYISFGKESILAEDFVKLI